MLTFKQVKGLRQWLCAGEHCGVLLGYYNNERLSLRERRGQACIDIFHPTVVERKCSICHTVNVLSFFGGRARASIR